MKLLPETSFNVDITNPLKNNIGLILGGNPYLLEYDEAFKTTQFLRDANKIYYFAQDTQTYPVLIDFLQIITTNENELLNQKVSYNFKDAMGIEKQIFIPLQRYSNPKNVNSISVLEVNFLKPIVISAYNYLFIEYIKQEMGSTVVTIGTKGIKTNVPVMPTMKNFIEENLRV